MHRETSTGEFTRLVRQHEAGSTEAGDDCLGDAALETGAPALERLLGEAAARPPDVPARIGGFRVIEKIGEGGMGAVYAAEQDHPHRRVALKMIRCGVMTGLLQRRFRAETELLGRLQHPGIAQIYEAGEVDIGGGRQPYFAMEFVEGPAIHRYARERNLEIPERLELVARVADAIHHAHARGVVHRDLKPDNILVTEEPAASPAGVPARFAALGQPKVLDFGVARATDSDRELTTMHTDAGEILGTLTYMSPEQISGRHEEVDARSDVYALGVILYELLAGRPPCDFRRMSIVEAARVAEEEEPIRLGTVDSACRGDIETIVGKALEKEPDRRYPGAAEFANDIRRHLAHEPIAARRPSASYQVRKFTRRHKGLVAGLAAAFAILIAGIAVTSVLAVRASRNAALAEARERATLATNYRFSPDGSRVVSGGNDGLVVVRDPETLVPLVALKGHESYIHDLDFSPDGTRLASASGDGTVRIWDATSAIERHQQSLKSRQLRTRAALHIERTRGKTAGITELVSALRNDAELDEDLRRECLRRLIVGQESPGGR